MEKLEPLLSVAVALLIGFLIGFEREQSAPDDEQERRQTFVGGARTYPLVALVGALSMLVGSSLGSAFVIIAFVLMASFIAIAYFAQVREHGDRGLTSETAFLVTFLLGALCTARGVIEPLSRRAVALGSIAVIVTLILNLKPRMHALAERATRDDVFATIKFLIVAVVILPLLPNETFGPLDVLNPSKIGLMVALIAGVDFVGYLATRVLGPGRGMGVTGIVGGLASSTAVTLGMSQRVRSTPALAVPCALAIVVASTIMAPRMLLLVWLVHGGLLGDLAWPLGGMLVGGVGSAFWLNARSQKSSIKGEALDIKNPFELSAALKFGLLFSVVLFASKLASQHLGHRGTYLAGILAGTTDVDAITLSMANLAKSGSVPARVAVTTIVLGAASNTVVKGVMAMLIAGRELGRLVLGSFGVALLGGAAGVAVLWLR